MFTLPRVGLAVMALGLVSILPARADIVFELGNNPQPNEENILFNSNQTASTVYGFTNQSHATAIFTSTTDTLVTTANGQAQVTALDGAVNDLSLSLGNKKTYTDLIINPFLHQLPSGNALVTVVATDGTFTFNYTLGNGNNFLTILATNGETISKTTIDATNGFQALKQPRISGVAGPSVIPEASSLWLLVSGGLPLGLGLTRRLRRNR